MSSVFRHVQEDHLAQSEILRTSATLASSSPTKAGRISELHQSRGTRLQRAFLLCVRTIPLPALCPSLVRDNGIVFCCSISIVAPRRDIEGRIQSFSSLAARIATTSTEKMMAPASNLWLSTLASLAGIHTQTLSMARSMDVFIYSPVGLSVLLLLLGLSTCFRLVKSSSSLREYLNARISSAIQSVQAAFFALFAPITGFLTTILYNTWLLVACIYYILNGLYCLATNTLANLIDICYIAPTVIGCFYIVFRAIDQSWRGPRKPWQRKCSIIITAMIFALFVYGFIVAASSAARAAQAVYTHFDCVRSAVCKTVCELWTMLQNGRAAVEDVIACCQSTWASFSWVAYAMAYNSWAFFTRNARAFAHYLGQVLSVFFSVLYSVDTTLTCGFASKNSQQQPPSQNTTTI